MAYLYLRYIESGIPFIIHGILCVVAYFVWFALVCITVPFMAAFRFLKLFETAIISYQKLGTVFSTLDLPFLHETEDNRNFIIGLLDMQGTPNIEKMRKTVLARLFDKDLDVTYKRLSQRVTHQYLSYIWCAEEKFNIRQHIPVYKGSIPKTKQDIEDLFCKLADESFPNNISPWKIYIIPKENKEEFLMFFKIHHVIGDGFAMIGLLSKLVDVKPEFIKPSKKRQSFTSNPVKRLIGGVLTGPLAVLTVMLSINYFNPFKTKQTPKKKKVSWTSPIQLKSVKKLKDVTGATVNDVLMSCLAGAVRHYLEEKQVFPTDLPIALTFNSRTNAEKNNEKIPLGNHSGGVFLNLPISIVDPIKRLEKTQYRMNKLKNLSHPHIFSFIYFNIIGCLPEVFGRASTFSLKEHVSMICSNVPGPTDQLQIMKYPVKSIIFTPPLHADIGVTVSIFSYCDAIKLTLLCDEKIISSPSRITELFEKEVNLLAERVLLDD